MNYNLALLAGNLTRGPELSYTTNQTPVCNFDIAVNSKYGEREETLFIKCTAFGSTAENITKYFTKGKPIFIEGRLVLDAWEAQDGSKRSRIKVTVNSFRFIGNIPQSNQTEEDEDF